MKYQNKVHSYLNNRVVIAICCSIAIAYSSCDNYVQFETPQPEHAQTIQKIPATYHGTYLDAEDNNVHYTINGKGVYKISSSQYNTPPHFLDSIPNCSSKKESFFTSFSTSDDECVQVTQDIIPNKLITVLYSKDLMWTLDSMNVAKIENNRIFINNPQQDYYQLHSIERTEEGIEIYEWQIDDLVNDQGIISEAVTIKINSNGKLQFAFSDSFDSFDRIDTTSYKELIISMLTEYDIKN